MQYRTDLPDILAPMILDKYSEYRAELARCWLAYVARSFSHSRKPFEPYSLELLHAMQIFVSTCCMSMRQKFTFGSLIDMVTMRGFRRNRNSSRTYLPFQAVDSVSSAFTNDSLRTQCLFGIAIHLSIRSTRFYFDLYGSLETRVSAFPILAGLCIPQAAQSAPASRTCQYSHVVET